MTIDSIPLEIPFTLESAEFALISLSSLLPLTLGFPVALPSYICIPTYGVHSMRAVRYCGQSRECCKVQVWTSSPLLPVFFKLKEKGAKHCSVTTHPTESTPLSGKPSFRTVHAQYRATEKLASLWAFFYCPWTFMDRREVSFFQKLSINLQTLATVQWKPNV